VLTDYHVHLRPDEPDTPAERFFTDDNVERYRVAADERGISELGASEHIHRFRQALEIWDHPFWVESAIDDLDDYAHFLAAGPLRCGIEMDWVPGAGERIAELLSSRPFDYVIGSVHFIGEGAVDHDGFDAWETAAMDPERVWGSYFRHLADAARSRLFDTLAHPDLVKVWGRGRPLPEGDLRRFYEPAVEAIAESGVAVEVSTAGLRKPVHELYPARELGELCVQAGVPFTLSSDAHVPDDLGYGYGEAVEFMRSLGIEEICVFEGRRRRMEPLG
jgi:histidinol-phosphatase (PHP family)